MFKIYCRKPNSDSKRDEEDRKYFSQLSIDQQRRYVQSKVIEMAKYMRELWHPTFLKSQRDITPYVKIRKAINEKLGTCYSSKQF